MSHILTLFRVLAVDSHYYCPHNLELKYTFGLDQCTLVFVAGRSRLGPPVGPQSFLHWSQWFKAFLLLSLSSFLSSVPGGEDALGTVEFCVLLLNAFSLYWIADAYFHRLCATTPNVLADSLITHSRWSKAQCTGWCGPFHNCDCVEMWGRRRGRGVTCKYDFE